MFKSPMVNEYNYDEFVCGGDNRELVQRVIDGKKPFASVVSVVRHRRDIAAMKVLHNMAKRVKRLVVSPLYIETTHYKPEVTGTRVVFNVTRRGTLSRLFDMEALAKFYDKEGYPEVAKDIFRKRNLGLSSYLDDWDWQQRAAKFSGNYTRRPWETPRKPPVEPWETGLILGYPPEFTVDNIYYGGMYVYRPNNPAKAVQDFLKMEERAGMKQSSVASRRKERVEYQIIQPGSR
jgi:hypothetical protein